MSWTAWDNLGCAEIELAVTKWDAMACYCMGFPQLHRPEMRCDELRRTELGLVGLPRGELSGAGLA